jgi:transposase
LPARIRALHDDLQPLQSLEPAGHLVRDVRGSDRLNRHHWYGGDR